MPIEVGDLLLWQSKLWLVHKIDPTTATAFVESQDHERHIVGTESDCPVTCNPTRDWPAIILPQRHGRLARVLISVNSALSPLKWLFAWVKLDEFQIGGSLYLNPELGLRYGDRIVTHIIFPDGRQTLFSIDVPRNFKPFSQKKKVIAKLNKKTTATLYDYLTEDNEFTEDKQR
jgi:hypothetical protein